MFKQSNIDFQSGSGSSSEIGFLKKINKKLILNIDLSLDEYNGVSLYDGAVYKWSTKHIGIQDAIIYKIFRTGVFDFNAKIGIKASTVKYGKQEMDRVVYDLMGEKELSGFVLVNLLAIQLKSNISKNSAISLGYNYNTSFNLANTSEEKLSFNINQIQLGVFFFNKK
ncbi:hypothetical protein QLS91_11860 [Flavobacterium sp. LB2P84]|uniref:hypothetical protein n=1 Tax=Flavobacterium yafengii TaxID=3041253 RepID=UPI0024A85AA6|nr:hypothetical protein [Flavobacterium yafengii]MDI6033769.1 hypothetical protein [Flavobacterium yafengii]